jgi:FG-GAP repeat
MVLWAADCEKSFAMLGMNRNLKIAFVLLVSLGHSVSTFAVDFARPVSYPVGMSPKGIAIADFNRDGKPDIAVANSGGSGEQV